MAADPVSACVLAFDYGSVRTGVAISPSNQAIAEVLTVLESGQSMWSQIKHLLAHYQPDILVVGWPRNLEANSTAQTFAAEQFAKQLKAQTNLPVVLQDEVMTSQLADQRINTKLPLKKQKEQRNSIAAAIILESYLREPNQEI
jgi:putative Holliday junction resolvase